MFLVTFVPYENHLNTFHFTMIFDFTDPFL